ncbi:MAG: methyltransferase domain-containing protein [Pseudomonadota bacterium]
MSIFKNKLFWIAVIGAVVAIGFYLKPNKWEAYYQNKLGNPPHAVVVKSVGLITKGNAPLTAIDFGAGVGNEAVYLLGQGFRVIAIDSQPIAFKMMRSREDTKSYLGRLQTVESSFEAIDWKRLPQVDLFVASLALPFCKPEAFPEIFAETKSHIKPGGIFVGHFFDPSYQGFSEKDRQAMTFLNKDQVLDLFVEFEILHFNETKDAGKSGTGADIVSHIYEVIARKKGTGT